MNIDCSCISSEEEITTFELGQRYCISLTVEPADGAVFRGVNDMTLRFGDYKYTYNFYADATILDAWIGFEITEDGDIIFDRESVSVEVDETDILQAIEEAKANNSNIVEVTPTEDDQTADLCSKTVRL